MTKPIIVIGGGPAGLAAAAVLKSKKLPALVLDKAPEVGASWMAHYDRLHLHTTRGLSGLPGLRIPRSEGQWVPRDGVVRYLKSYADHHGLDIRHGVKVQSVRSDGRGVHIDTSESELHAPAAIIATGYNNRPILPEWPGRDEFTGDLRHSADYRNPSDYQGKDVLVVGSGNTGAEIAVDLLEGGARDVTMSIRSAPHVIRRSILGTPAQVTGVFLRHLPIGVIDRLTQVTTRASVGDLTPYGMPKPTKGMMTRLVKEDAVPILDVGLVDALKARKLRIVNALAAFEGSEVVLVDGTRLQPDAVVAATGFAKALDELIGIPEMIDELGRPVVHGPRTDPRLPDVYFIGFSAPLSGNLRELGIDARRIARAIARRKNNGTDGA